MPVSTVANSSSETPGFVAADLPVAGIDEPQVVVARARARARSARSPPPTVRRRLHAVERALPDLTRGGERGVQEAARLGDAGRVAGLVPLGERVGGGGGGDARAGRGSRAGGGGGASADATRRQCTRQGSFGQPKGPLNVDSPRLRWRLTCGAAGDAAQQPAGRPRGGRRSRSPARGRRARARPETRRGCERADGSYPDPRRRARRSGRSGANRWRPLQLQPLVRGWIRATAKPGSAAPVQVAGPVAGGARRATTPRTRTSGAARRRRAPSAARERSALQVCSAARRDVRGELIDIGRSFHIE